MSLENSISRLEICISRLEMYISSLEIYISKLEMKFSRSIDKFLCGEEKFLEELLRTTFLFFRSFALPTRLVKLLLHRRILVGELANSQVFRILVGQAEIVLRTQQAFLHPLELGY